MWSINILFWFVAAGAQDIFLAEKDPAGSQAGDGFEQPVGTKIVAALPVFDTGRHCDVTQFGAVADNRTDCTHAFRAATAVCGTVLVPAGIFRTAAFNLTSNQLLSLAAGATLVAQPDVLLYPTVLGLPPLGTRGRLKTSPCALVSAYWATNVSVMGAGRDRSVIDGLGWQWSQNHTEDHFSMISLFQTYKCTDVTVAGLTLQNSPTWTLHPFGSDGVHIHDLAVRGPREAGGVSGIHPDSSRNVLIEDCFVDVGDDGIVVASYQDLFPEGDGKPLPAENILVRNCTVLSRNIAIGAGTSGGIRNVTFEDCAVGDDSGSSPWGIKVKSQTYLPATIEDVTFRRLRLGRIQPNSWQQPKAQAAIDIGLQYNEPLVYLPRLRNIVLEDITVTSAVVVGRIVGLDASHIAELVVRNVTYGHFERGWTCVNTDAPVISSVTPGLVCT